MHQFPGGTKREYEASVAAVHPSDASLPAGQIFYASGPSADGWTTVAVKDPPESWGGFVTVSLCPRCLKASKVASLGNLTNRSSTSTTSSRLVPTPRRALS